MSYRYVWIDEENREGFLGVLPENLRLTSSRIAFGVTEEDGTALGALSCVFLNYQYNLDWIYVEPEKRRQWIGTRLLDQLIQTLEKSGEVFPLSAEFAFSPEDSLLHSFFLSQNRMLVSFSHERYVIHTEDIRSSGMLSGGKLPKGVDVSPFFSLPEPEQRRILENLAKDQAYSVSDYGAWKEACVLPLCLICHIKEKAVGGLFTRETEKGALTLSYLWSEVPSALSLLLVKAAGILESEFPESSLTFDAYSEEAEKMAGRYFKGAKKIHIYEAMY